MKKIKVISCVITFAVMALIFFFSSQTATDSALTSAGITRKIAQFIASVFRYNKPHNIYAILHFLVRKAAHFLLFFMLGLSVTNAMLCVFGWERLRLFAYAAAFCLLYAISDEIHQIFVPGRAAMLMDVLIDLAGAMLGSVIFILGRGLCLKRRRNTV